MAEANVEVAQKKNLLAKGSQVTWTGLITMRETVRSGVVDII